MKTGLGSASRAIVVVLTWGLAWAIPGGAIEALANLGIHLSFERNVDMWPQTLAIPGLIGGLLFCGVVAGAGRWRALETSSLGLLLGLGGVVGLAMAGIVATGVVGGEESWGAYAFVLVMSPVAAVASGLLFRYLARKREPARAEV